MGFMMGGRVGVVEYARCGVGMVVGDAAEWVLPRSFTSRGIRKPASVESGQMPEVTLKFMIEHDREEDGRWLAEVPVLPGVLACGATAD